VGIGCTSLFGGEFFVSSLGTYLNGSWLAKIVDERNKIRITIAIDAARNLLGRDINLILG
jgi:hypothetical protein